MSDESAKPPEADDTAAPAPKPDADHPERVLVPEGVESELPEDVPQILLPAFEGPLDLLLYLIRRDKIDIHDIPIAPITRQYMEYLDLMRELNLELAGEFMVMAATLIHIKSKMLLPRPETAAGVESNAGGIGWPFSTIIRTVLCKERLLAQLLNMMTATIATGKPNTVRMAMMFSISWNLTLIVLLTLYISPMIRIRSTGSGTITDSSMARWAIRPAKRCQRLFS